jgi:hypothetical protein
MAVIATPAVDLASETDTVSVLADVSSANTVRIQVTLPSISPATWGTIAFNVRVIP